MDFIEGLPVNEKKSVILVVVDRLTKYIHFIGLQHPYTASIVAKAYLGQVFKLHELPSSIVSDRDKVCTSNFWQDLFKALGYQPSQWFKWLALSEWWYNISYHTSLKMSLFKALYGYNPPHMAFPYTTVTSVSAVESYLNQRDAMLDLLKESLQKAQERMKFFADKSSTDRSLEVGDRKVGSLAYKLELPSSARIHPVFHVSQLKKQIGKAHIPSPVLPVVDHAGEVIMRPEKVLSTRSITTRRNEFNQLLIQWTNSAPEDATWEDKSNIQAHYPNFILEDKDTF
ncbi:uncharacterized protein LOC113331394 [Papaver somniferum]|uniref:uncharacterized protein LOC113331394 n=1 Tax=Papaver somniferum TaxID=3469 RepID=UPI000E705D38|nr:uncharacterized protein LOC113331394 [Papaver somniferum]